MPVRSQPCPVTVANPGSVAYINPSHISSDTNDATGRDHAGAGITTYGRIQVATGLVCQRTNTYGYVVAASGVGKECMKTNGGI